jgi:hypothetical protein
VREPLEDDDVGELSARASAAHGVEDVLEHERVGSGPGAWAAPAALSGYAVRLGVVEQAARDEAS